MAGPDANVRPRPGHRVWGKIHMALVVASESGQEDLRRRIDAGGTVRAAKRPNACAHIADILGVLDSLLLRALG